LVIIGFHTAAPAVYYYLLGHVSNALLEDILNIATHEIHIVLRLIKRVGIVEHGLKVLQAHTGCGISLSLSSQMAFIVSAIL
jgi:hypothetical protein